MNSAGVIVHVQGLCIHTCPTPSENVLRVELLSYSAVLQLLGELRQDRLGNYRNVGKRRTHAPELASREARAPAFTVNAANIKIVFLSHLAIEMSMNQT